MEAGIITAAIAYSPAAYRKDDLLFMRMNAADHLSHVLRVSKGQQGVSGFGRDGKGIINMGVMLQWYRVF